MTHDDDAFSAAFDGPLNEGATTSEAPEERAEPSGQTEAPQNDAETTQEAPAVTPAQAETQPPQEKPVPIEQWKGYLDEREKRQEFERRAQELERQLQALTQQNTAPQKAPDVFDDPEGFQRYQALQAQQAVLKTKSDLSMFMAEREFGRERVQQADAWVRQQPRHVLEQLLASPSPYHAAIDAMKREQALNALKDHDYDIEKLIAARNPQPVQPVQPTMPQGSNPNLPPAVRPSGTLGKEPSQTDETIFRSVFS